MPVATLLLIDGTALLYRAFYAIRELTTRAGRPTNAVFGFVRMLGQLRRTWRPSHWLVAFDGGLPAERVALLESYKAQRPEMPAGLRAQVTVAEDYLERAAVPWLRREGQEADDVLAAAARWAAPRADRVLIATNDKDFYQLVDEKISIVSPAGKPDRLDAEGVRAKTGVLPERIVEWLALVGDSSDNIPGVPGIGAKTAARLLSEHGSLAGIWKAIDRAGNARLRDALATHREAVERNLAIVRLRTDLKWDMGWDALAVKEADAARLLPLLRELEFDSMVRELESPQLL